MRPLILFLFCLGMCYPWPVSTLAAPRKPKPQLFVPMDYSTCGYRASEELLPDVKVAAYVACSQGMQVPSSGDCSAIIQQAIDRVSALKPDKDGRRGAVLLGEGTFRIDQPLRIAASGVVLRGMGREKTRIVKHGTDRGAMIYIEGVTAGAASRAGQQMKDTLFVSADMIPAGSTTLTVGQTRGGAPAMDGGFGQTQGAAPAMTVGSRITIVRPCTWEWIDHLRMDDFGGGLDYTGWKPTDIELRWDRTVTAVSGDTLVIDAPITTAIEQRFGGAYIIRGRHEGELTECGVENLTLESTVNTWNPKDEDHCWDGIYADNVRDSWVRRVNFRHLAGSAVNLQKQTSRITVEDCIASEPVSEIGGWRRQVFLTRGQQTLFQRCISRQGIHDFAAGFCAAGPNAFVQCEGEESLGFSGSIGSWAPGLLFDIVDIDGHDLCFANLEQFQFGTGWNTANSMFWQCTASTIACYSPDTLNRCSAHGCWGTLTGNGNWTSSNDHVQPRSLFYDQLQQRLAGNASAHSTAGNASGLSIQAYLLPRPTNATSSPTVEQAMELARESLTEPRLTLEMWIDSIPFTASTSPINPSSPTPSPSSRGGGAGATGAFGVSASSWPTLSGSLYSIPWWSGRVKDNFCERDAKPAITRFVPGREGTGWTDRIDSVVAFLANNGYAALDHNYGLWYDLRRTDHERVRRADGDVWAPFYEQPFARSGQGTAWDGLSLYDLTRPNEWYWGRLREFAGKAAAEGIMLFNHHYFQHNILEAGAHWVDCPWRPVNNIQFSAPDSKPAAPNSPFPEPVPFAGDKRVFMAEQFYDETNPALRPLHRQYIRMCLDQLKDQPNVVHLISAEYTGPLHFTRFWLETIAEWEHDTGRHPLIALSCTRDVQDSLLADPALSKVVDIIDIRYWHYNTEGLWAPEGGKNMAPRQWMRKMKVGKTGFDEAYRAVREMRDRYPDKAVTFFSQQYPNYGWAILMAGGSLANVPLKARSPQKSQSPQPPLLSTLSEMLPLDGEGCVALGKAGVGYLVYTRAEAASLPVADGVYTIYTVNTTTGEITLKEKKARLTGSFTLSATSPNRVFWLQPKP